jgi:ParB-like chromosome segregation protein Spo0J
MSNRNIVVGPEGSKRVEDVLISPFDVIVKEDVRGRWKAPSREKIVERALNMMEHGQLQAVAARKLEDKRISLIYGFTRCAAGRLIREGFTDPATGEEKRDPDFRLRVKIVEGNEKEGFIQNVLENAVRDDTSPIDDAHNHRKLRENYALSDTEIAKLIRADSTNRIADLRKLLLLTDEQKELVHERKMSVDAALALLTFPEEKRPEVVQKSLTAKGKVDGAKLRDQARQFALEISESQELDEAESAGDDAEPSVIPMGGVAPTPVVAASQAEELPSHVLRDASDKQVASQPREDKPANRFAKPSMRQVRKYLDEMIADEETDPAVRECVKVMKSWLEGRRRDQSMTKALNALLEAKPAKRKAQRA